MLRPIPLSSLLRRYGDNFNESMDFNKHKNFISIYCDIPHLLPYLDVKHLHLPICDNKIVSILAQFIYLRDLTIHSTSDVLDLSLLTNIHGY